MFSYAPPLERRLCMRTVKGHRVRLLSLRPVIAREKLFQHGDALLLRAAKKGTGGESEDKNEPVESTPPEDNITAENPAVTPTSPSKPPPSEPSFIPTTSRHRVPPLLDNPKKVDDFSNGDEGEVQPWKEDRAGEIRKLKASLLTTVAGYDRGFAAVARDTAKVRTIIESLETLSGSIDLTSMSTSGKDSLSLFDGLWKLVYASALNLGGSERVITFSPFVIGPIYQVVDTKDMKLKNIFDFISPSPFQLPFSPSNAKPKLRLTLTNDMSWDMSTVKVSTKEGSLGLVDSGVNIPDLSFPISANSALPLPSGGNLSREFSMIYLDEDLYISASDQRDIRVLVRVQSID